MNRARIPLSHVVAVLRDRIWSRERERELRQRSRMYVGALSPCFPPFAQPARASTGNYRAWSVYGPPLSANDDSRA